MTFMSLLGVILLITGIVIPLFSASAIKPNHLVFAGAAVINGFILIVQGWRSDPILQFCQLILAVVTIFYTFETVQLRRHKP
ncbi:MAG TPA: Ycf66 family protein [Nostocaceae cyanobacterium]|nr:Ycf66 family protein [Nostocaceae cyanobacterium]